MMIYKPKEISDKIKFVSGGVAVKKGIKLTVEEQKIYEDFKKSLAKANKNRFN